MSAVEEGHSALWVSGNNFVSFWILESDTGVIQGQGDQGDFCGNKGLFVKGLLDPCLFY